MQAWEYKKIERELDMSGYDTPEDYMMLGPGMGPSHKWTDFSLEEGTSEFTDEMTRLDRLGADGWELVSVQSEKVGRTFTDTYYLKRAVE